MPCIYRMHNSSHIKITKKSNSGKLPKLTVHPYIPCIRIKPMHEAIPPSCMSFIHHAFSKSKTKQDDSLPFVQNKVRCNPKPGHSHSPTLASSQFKPCSYLRVRLSPAIIF